MSSYRAGAGRYFSVRRNRIAAFHLDAVESLAGQAGLCVAELDPRLAGLVVKQEVGPPVAVHILDVAGAVRLCAIALCWVVVVSPWTSTLDCWLGSANRSCSAALGSVPLTTLKYTQNRQRRQGLARFGTLYPNGSFCCPCRDRSYKIVK